MTTLIARLRQAAEKATPGPWTIDGPWLEDNQGRTLGKLTTWDGDTRNGPLIALLGSNVLKIVAALEAADMLLDEVAQAAPLLDMFPDDLAEAMGGLRLALAALDQEEE